MASRPVVMLLCSCLLAPACGTVSRPLVRALVPQSVCSCLRVCGRCGHMLMAVNVVLRAGMRGDRAMACL